MHFGAPQPALSLQSFHLLSALFGMALVLGLHKLKAVIEDGASNLILVSIASYANLR